MHLIKRLCLSFITLLLLLLPFKAIIAQTISFRHLTVADGLSQNSVLAIGQDAQGFMWFGTQYGLNRYDGTGFKIYEHTANAHSLSNEYVQTILVDKEHTLWIGTLNGLNKYRPETDDFENSGNTNNIHFDSQIINCLYEDRNNNLWVGTRNGLNLLSGKNKSSFQRFSVSANNLAGDDVRSIYQDFEGAIWAGTTTGLSRITPKNNNWQFENYRSNAGLIDSFITAISEDKMHRLWIGTQNNGIDTFNRLANLFSPLVISIKDKNVIAYNRIRTIAPDAFGSIWVGTQDGVIVYNLDQKKYKLFRNDPADKNSLNQNSVYSTFHDANNTTWVGTYYSGINIADNYSEVFKIYQAANGVNSLSSNIITGFLEDGKNNLLITTEGGGLNILNRNNNAILVYKNQYPDLNILASNYIKTIYKDRNGNIWLGTHGGGLEMFNALAKTFTSYLYKTDNAATANLEISSILEDTNNRLWLGFTGPNSALRLYKKTGRAIIPLHDIKLDNIQGKGVKALYESKDEKIWAVTSSGLYVLPKSANAFITVKGLEKDNVNCIKEDRWCNIWIGKYYHGLAKIDAHTGAVTTYTTNQGLANNNVVSIQQDAGNNLWIATTNGLSYFNIQQQTFRNFTTADGLPGNEFNYNASYQSANGEMFFGGFNGFISFFPDRIKINKYAAPIVFTGLRLLNQPVIINGTDKVLSKNINLTKEINLDYNQDVFTIDFALLNYIKPAKNKYAYKLEGLDEDWTETKGTFVTYTHLAPGNYTLLVKGANNDGVWSKPASLKINVLPPFWKTWWAYILYVLFMFAIIFFVTRFFFLRALIKKEEALHQFKLNFFTNISHEIRTNLALILGPVEKLIYSSRNDAAIGKQLTQIKKNAERLLKLVNEQMDFRKAETGNLKLQISKENIVAFVEEIYATFQNLAISKNIKTTFASDNDNIDMYFDRQQLEKVFFNILSNAYKFTQNGGEVDISIKEQRNTVEIKIVDNGKGISKENLPKLFNNFYQEDDTNTQNTGYGIGLALAKSIVQLHKGELIAESFVAEKPGENKTAFTVKLPKGHYHFESNYIISHTPNIALKENENTEIALPATVQEASLPQQELLTVLLVEDNAEVRSFISESLNTVYNVVESVNGLKGWEAATELIPDIIISDVMMPEMDGYTLCHRLKADERTSHIPIILLTAKSAAENYVSGLEMGADIYLTKPFSIRVLELHLRNLIITRQKLQQYFNRKIETVSTPELPVKSAVIPNKIDEDFLNRAIQIVEDCMNDPDFGVNKFATKIAMSPPVLYKKLKAVTDMSVNDFIKSLRLQKAHQLIQNSEADIKDVAYMVGYKDSKYFVKEYKKRFDV